MQGDQCLDSPCYHAKVNAHIDREIAARPELVQIENGYRSPKEQRPGAVQRGHFREIEAVVENPDAEPAPPCAAAKTAIIVYGKRVGTTLTICTDNNCPVHDPRAAAHRAENPAPTLPPPVEAETEAEAEQRKQQYQQQRREFEAEEERRAEESKQQREQEFRRQQEEYEAEQARRDETRKARAATFERILANAPATFTAAHLRVLLRALVNLDPYTFADDLAEDIVADNENEQRSAEEVLLSTIDATADDKLSRFALRLALAGHVGVPREGEFDFLTEAETVFVPAPPKKDATPKKAKQPKPTESSVKDTRKAKAQKVNSGKKKIAA